MKTGECDPTALEYLATLGVLGRSPGTINSYRKVLRQWCPFLGRPTVEATRLDALRYVKARQDAGRAPGDVRLHSVTLRAFYNWLLAEGLVSANPFERLKITVPERIEVTATDADVEAMVKEAGTDRRALALVYLLADTGARCAEVANVAVGDLDFMSGTVRFRISKTQARVVPLSDRAYLALQRWLRKRGTTPGNIWSVVDGPQWVSKTINRLSKSTMTPHALRRGFAVRWLQSGGSETGLMRIAGWRSVTMIARYTRASADLLAADEMRRLMS